MPITDPPPITLRRRIEQMAPGDSLEVRGITPAVVRTTINRVRRANPERLYQTKVNFGTGGTRVWRLS